MNENEFLALWNGPGNQLVPAEEARLKAALLQRIRRQRWLDRAGLGWGALGLGAFSLILAKLALDSRLSPRLVWSTLPLFFLPAAMLVLRWRALRARVRAQPGLPMLEVVQLAQAEHKALRRRLQWFGALWLISLPVMGRLGADLGAQGKARPQELLSMLSVLGLLLATSAGVALWVWVYRLRPEGARLQALLASLDPRDP